MAHDPPKDGLTIITTHINADYDALASTLAAQKLYPEAVVAFPGSHEKNLRNFFIQSMVYLFNMRDIRDIDFSAVKRLVLVDTRQPSRIGRFADLLSRNDIDIHIYDHHPPMPDDIKGHFEVIEETGAAVSILTERIRERGLDLMPEEATIMCMGLYEDTGSFTFTSTTEKDLLTGAYLLSRGANLEIVASMTAREMSFEQVSLLNDMLQSLVRYHIKGVEVAITRVSTERYVQDFARLVHKVVKMEDLRAFFAVARMANKVYVVGRSRAPEVDAGEIIGRMGGGGHPYAASATLRNRTLAQAEQQLIELLYEKVRSSKRAKDLMSSPPILVDAETPLHEARTIINRYNINALLVTERQDGVEALTGYITRQVISKAIYLKLENARVGDYMQTDAGVVGPEADLLTIQREIVDNKQRVLPVVDDDGKPVGVITRTDLLNAIVQHSEYAEERTPNPHKEEINARTRNIRKLMDERLPEHLFDLLVTAGEVADEMGFGAYVVGGFVRDLYLFRPNEDIDIVVEGSGIEFARKFGKRLSARVHPHEKFGTAVVIFPDGFKVDVVTARMEYYRFPADMPIVEMSSIKLDMYRRDFTINTLAIQLNANRFGTLIDFFSAQKDIKEKAIRILHNLSFVEDPTRVYRAIRFEQRFGFTIGKLTAGLIENAVKMDFFKRLSGRRTMNELRQILEEENPAPAIRRLHDFDLLKVIHEKLKPTPKVMEGIDEVKKVLDWHDLLFLEEPYRRWVVFFMALIRQFDPMETANICEGFEMRADDAKIFQEERFDAERCLYWLMGKLPTENSVIYQALAPFRIELLLYMMAAAPGDEVKKSISHYFTHLRQVTTEIRGRDLVNMGIPPGPVYKDILNATLNAKLNGLLNSREDELRFAMSYVG